MNFKEWVRVVASMLVIVSIAGAVGLRAGDQRWVTVKWIGQKLDRIEINALDRQITFLQIKIDEGEATSSERIWIKSLKQQKRAVQGGK